jgi:cell pole-organizing protein PopZ
MAKAQAQEPSMEEILASIRRIIADEDTGPAAASKLAAVTAKAAPEVSVSEDELDKLFESGDEDEDVLDLDETDKASEETHMSQEDLDLAFEPAPKPVPQPVKSAAPPPPKPDHVKVAAPAPERRQPEPRPEPSYESRREDSPLDSLLSQSTDSMVSNAFDNLALTILNKNARTVEDLIQDMLRPMLRSWLDQNLPTLVERLVRAEIERVSRSR